MPFVLSGVFFDPAAPDLLFASGYAEDDGGLYVSADGGASWARLPVNGSVLHADGARRMLYLLDGGELKAYRWGD